MLVLSRKIGERIQIGINIFVVVLDNRGGRIRLGIEAPREIEVCREEIVQSVYAKPENVPVPA